jgi:hypothetical protein
LSGLNHIITLLCRIMQSFNFSTSACWILHVNYQDCFKKSTTNEHYNLLVGFQYAHYHASPMILSMVMQLEKPSELITLFICRVGNGSMTRTCKIR